MAQTSSFGNLVRLRRSVRHFLPTPLADLQMNAVLGDAQRSPSNCNTQPWMVHIASGAAKEALTKTLTAHAREARFSSDFSWDETAFPDIPDARPREQGKTYYESLGIARNDAAGRQAGLLKNLEFFGATHVAFLFMRSVGDNVRVAADLGMYAQTFLLSLTARGFAGIPQTVLGLFSDPVRATVCVPGDMKLLFGISFGHAGADATSVPYMPRAPLSDSIVRHG